MIITFDPKVGTSVPDVNATYINFLRCVTAACTAAAGTTTLTVNPYTASNTIDTTKNCILSIDANTEAGGWTTSSSHNVPSSGNNTPQTFTAISSNGAYTTNYKADFHVASGKSTYPFLKLAFHIPVSNTRDNWNYTGPTFPGQWDSYPAVCSTFGHSTTSNWTDTSFVPTNSTQSHNNAFSFTPFKDMGTRGVDPYYASTYNPWYMNMGQNVVKYKIAVTANYCIIWEINTAYNSYVTGYNTSYIATGDYSYYRRYGSIIYHGLRETQGWENTYNDNPPWVSWGYLHSAMARTSSATNYNHFPSNSVGAWMRTQTDTSQVSTPSVKVVQSNGGTASFTDVTMAAWGTQTLQVPLFKTRIADGPYMGTTTATLNPPQADPVTGLQVPGAYPIIIRSTIPDSYNAGGACRGIYKSLSMPFANMKNYWTAENQTFNINGETYIPIVIREDMWLIRAA
jgi:hypothetical protein